MQRISFSFFLSLSILSPFTKQDPQALPPADLAFAYKNWAPDRAPCLSLAAAVVIVVAAAAQIVAIAVAAAAEQQDQDDDPPATVTAPRITTHNRYLRKKICYGLRRTFHVIPMGRKGAAEDGFFGPYTVWYSISAG